MYLSAQWTKPPQSPVFCLRPYLKDSPSSNYRAFFQALISKGRKFGGLVFWAGHDLGFSRLGDGSGGGLWSSVREFQFMPPLFKGWERGWNAIRSHHAITYIIQSSRLCCRALFILDFFRWKSKDTSCHNHGEMCENMFLVSFGCSTFFSLRKKKNSTIHNLKRPQEIRRQRPKKTAQTISTQNSSTPTVNERPLPVWSLFEIVHKNCPCRRFFCVYWFTVPSLGANCCWYANYFTRPLPQNRPVVSAIHHLTNFHLIPPAQIGSNVMGRIPKPTQVSSF